MRGILLAAVVALASLGLSASAHAQTIVDGKTAPVFDYDQAIRERVYIPNGQDSDLDGVEDRTFWDAWDTNPAYMEISRSKLAAGSPKSE